MPQSISESMEHYLTAILRLSEAGGIARVRDISQVMGVKNSSATNAVQSLTRAGFVRHETYGYVELTGAGKRLARDVVRRRETLLRFLEHILEIDPERAQKDACGMEHSLSKETLERLVKFIEFMEGEGTEGVAAECRAQLRERYSSGEPVEASQDKRRAR